MRLRACEDHYYFVTQDYFETEAFVLDLSKVTYVLWFKNDNGQDEATVHFETREMRIKPELVARFREQYQWYRTGKKPGTTPGPKSDPLFGSVR